jgi:lycopene beta-cyclase
MPEYFIILLGILLITVFLHKYFKIRLYKSAIHFLTFNVVNILLATIWDQIAIARGHWGFNPRFLLGIKIGFMPIEEFLFVLIISYFALILFKILEKRF